MCVQVSERVCVRVCVWETEERVSHIRPSPLHRGWLPEQPPELLVLTIHVTCSLQKHTRQMGEGGSTGGEEKEGEERENKNNSLFWGVDILQGAPVYSRRIHRAPLSLGLLFQVVLQHGLFPLCTHTHTHTQTHTHNEKSE